MELVFRAGNKIISQKTLQTFILDTGTVQQVSANLEQPPLHAATTLVRVAHSGGDGGHFAE